ncbi:hypothetical protein [Rubripirellula reticaptiva]|uniref:Uncharacterized protein n=1 Tax=Rubripirellula reticaptiva TaxID=2528013 RepID=A0A5C6ES80_9BACT|nr:hypothetical protein [Rubripirellula reticaptiva]TWU51505.1 hypothetical protein Poly59_30970 [Rubripirellula reticaptiva]
MSKPYSATGIYFWPYDIFGYFLPGVVALAPLTQFHTDIRAIIVARFQTTSWVDIAMLCIVAYVLGHIIAAVSSWLLERVLLKYTFGYPVIQLFCGYNSGPWLRKSAAAITELHKRAPFKWLRDKGGLHWAFRLSRFTSRNCRPLLDLIPGFVHLYDSTYRKALERKFRRLCDVEYPDWSIKRRSHDLFWTVQAYSMEHMPTVYRSSMHFVELYGFSRNTSLAFLIVALYPLCPDWDTSVNGSQPIETWVWSTCCGVASFAMYVNFVKLLRRHNDLLLRAFVANARIDEPSDAPESASRAF